MPYLSWKKTQRSNNTSALVLYARAWCAALVVLFLDQWSKWWVMHALPYDGGRTLIHVCGRWLNLVHAHNGGAAWGMLAGHGVLLVALACVALIAIVWCRKALLLHKPTAQWAFGLIFGGVAGNLIDRLRYGYVIDFIDCYLPGYRWPAFNVADAAICIGAFMYLIWGAKTR